MQTFKKDDLFDGYRGDSLRRPLRRQVRGRDFDGIKKAAAALAALACFVVAILAVSGNIRFSSAGYLLTINGQDVALFASADEADSVIEDYITSKSLFYGVDITYSEKVEVIKINAYGRQCVTAAECFPVAEQLLTPVVMGTALIVDGVRVLCVADNATALRVLDYVKDYYISAGDEVTDVKFRQVVETASVCVRPEDISSRSVAQNILLSGSGDLQTHIVQSAEETLWTISKQHSVPVETLQSSNPGLTSEDLYPGMAVNIVPMEGLLTIVVVRNEVEQNSIGYGSRTINNAFAVRGTEIVAQAGVKGLEEVTTQVVEENGYEVRRTLIASTVLIAPTEEIIEKGTKVVAATKPGVANGMLSWPLTVGLDISSRYGPRPTLGDFHTGLDMRMPTGTKVVAAEGGEVFFAGWSGGYGYVIKVNHGGGLETYYAHMSTMDVGVGDVVKRGEVIGRSGNTGRSTGPHLHFEVQVNGNHYDPLNYLP